MKCVVCDKEATYFLIHKETKTLYPICEKCVKNKFYPCRFRFKALNEMGSIFSFVGYN